MGFWLVREFVVKPTKLHSEKESVYSQCHYRSEQNSFQNNYPIDLNSSALIRLCLEGNSTESRAPDLIQDPKELLI